MIAYPTNKIPLTNETYLVSAIHCRHKKEEATLLLVKNNYHQLRGGGEGGVGHVQRMSALNPFWEGVLNKRT